MKTEIKKMIFSIIIGTILALSAHILMMKVCFYLNSLFNPAFPLPNPHYSALVMTLAYLTAIFPTSVLVIAYYFGGQILTSKKKYINALILTLFVLGLKGELLRLPLMDLICNIQFGFEGAAISSFFKHFHVWIANFILSFSVVYFGPIQNQNLTKVSYVQGKI